MGSSTLQSTLDSALDYTIMMGFVFHSQKNWSVVASCSIRLTPNTLRDTALKLAPWQAGSRLL